MDPFQVPDIFEDSPNVLSEPEGPTIINYYQDQEVEKANVQLNKNLIVFIKRGFKRVLGEQENVTVKTGQGFFLRKGNYLMSEKLGEQNNYSSFLIFFSDTFAHQFSTEYSHLIPEADTGKKNISTFANSSSTNAFLKSLENYFSDSKVVNVEGLASLKLKELFLLLATSDKETGFMHFLQRLKSKPSYHLRNFMNLHYKENLKLDEYAFLTGYSLSTFKRLFKKEFNTTPGRWIKERKLQEAKFLLRSTRKNVSEICFEAGFENVSHFVQSFKRKYDVTPKRFQVER